MHLRELVWCLVACIVLACNNSNTEQKTNILSTLKSLQKNQAKASFKIDGVDFYHEQSLFEGGGYAEDSGIKISLKNKMNGNIIVSIEGDGWNKKKPYKVIFKDGFPVGSSSGSFLLGRISDISQNKGEGYVLYNGFFEIQYFSENYMYVVVEGEAKSPFGDAPNKKISGNITWAYPDVKHNFSNKAASTIPL